MRSSVSRLKRRGVIAPESRGGAAGYRLTERGEAILRAGDARIFARAQRAPAGCSWCSPSRRPSAPCATACARGSPASGWARSRPRCGSRRRSSRPRSARWSTSSACTSTSSCSRRSRWAAHPAHWWDLDPIAAEYARYVADWEPALERGRRRLRRLHPPPRRLAPDPVPRPGAARGAAPGRLARRARLGGLPRARPPPRRGGAAPRRGAHGSSLSARDERIAGWRT